MTSVSAINLSQFAKQNPGLLTADDAKLYRKLKSAKQKDLFLKQKLNQKYDSNVQDAYRTLVRQRNIENAGKAKIKPTAPAVEETVEQTGNAVRRFWAKLKNVDKKWWIGGAVLVAALGGVIAAVKNNNDASTVNEAA